MRKTVCSAILCINTFLKIWACDFIEVEALSCYNVTVRHKLYYDFDSNKKKLFSLKMWEKLTKVMFSEIFYGEL